MGVGVKALMALPKYLIGRRQLKQKGPDLRTFSNPTLFNHTKKLEIAV